MTTQAIPIRRRSQSALHSWLLGLSKDSLHRLKLINLSTSSSKHVILALTYGFCDPSIGKLNKMITTLLIARMRAERQGKTRLVVRINDLMEDMHAAIDQATGCDRRISNGTPCNRSGAR